MNRQLPADLQFLLNWKHSVFWAFAGILSVATCVSSTNRRLKAEVRLPDAESRHPRSAAATDHTKICVNQAERVQLQQHKVEMLEHVLR
jgi:hypothetical protein